MVGSKSPPQPASAAESRGGAIKTLRLVPSSDPDAGIFEGVLKVRARLLPDCEMTRELLSSEVKVFEQD